MCISQRAGGVFTHHNRSQLCSSQASESQSRGQSVCSYHSYAEVSVAHSFVTYFLFVCLFFNIQSDGMDRITYLSRGFRSGASTINTGYHKKIKIFLSKVPSA